MKTTKNQLTTRQQQFCQHYVGAARHNAALAARMADYAATSSHVSGCKLLQLPKIAAVVRGLEHLAAKEMGLTRQRVMNELQEAAGLAKLLGQPMGIIAAWKAIAQAAGFDKPEKVTGGLSAGLGQLHAQFESMTDQQLLAIIGGGGATHSDDATTKKVEGEGG